jgi:DNA-binding transcriptional MerR regulator
MTTNQILRAYSIKDVSKRINIPTGTIRQWEKDLKGILYIPRSQQGARFYTEKEIIVLAKVKEMRAKNLSKDMIRTLLEKHMKEGTVEASEPPSETFEPSSQAVANQEVMPVQAASPPIHTQNFDDFYTAMETYKASMLSEIKEIVKDSRKELMEDFNNELTQASLQTVQGLSKSIQRSNEKTKTEFMDLSESIAQASELTSETFEALSDSIAKVSEDNYAKISKRISESSKTTTKDYKNLMNKVSQTVNEAQKDIRIVSKSLHKDQEHFVDSMNQNLKELTQVIREREDAFQDMVSSFREAAAARDNKKWWRLWF